MLAGKKCAGMLEVCRGSQQTFHRRAAIRDLQTSRLVVSFILETWGASERGIEFRSPIAAQCHETLRSGTIQGECPHRIQLVQLRMETVAAIFCGEQGILVGKGEIVKDE